MPVIEVSKTELANVGSANNLTSLFAGFLGLSFGTLVTVIVTLSTVTFPVDMVLLKASYWMASILFGILALLFGSLTALFYWRAGQSVEAIWSQRIDAEENNSDDS